MTAPLATPRAPPPCDAEGAVRSLLSFVGEDPGRDGLRETPARVARALLEMTEGYSQDPAAILGTVFEEPMEEMVLLRDVEFWSLCEHHLLPFHGRASVAYLPRDRVVGLSKLARLVQCHARRLQLQERLTRDVAESLARHLDCRGAAVLVEAEHACMRMRGVRGGGAMVTSAFLGEMRDPPRRREFLGLLGRA